MPSLPSPLVKYGLNATKEIEYLIQDRWGHKQEETMKPTLSRIRNIIKAHIDDFAASSLITAFAILIIHTLLLQFNEDKLPTSLANYVMTKITVTWMLAAFALVPPLAIIFMRTAHSVTGSTTRTTDPNAQKRFFFMAAGVFWASLSVLGVSIINNIDYLILGSMILSLTSWICMIRAAGSNVVL